MTSDEWLPIVKVIRDCWPQQPWPRGTIAIGFALLSDLEAKDVQAAVMALSTNGREFAPPPGVIRRRVLDMRQPGTTFEDAWDLIRRAMSLFGRPRPADAEAYLTPHSNGMVWSLVIAMGGWEQICNGGFDEYKPTDPGVWRSQAEHAWRGLEAQRREDAALVDLPTDMPRVRAAREREVSQLTRVGDSLLPKRMEPPEDE